MEQAVNSQENEMDVKEARKKLIPIWIKGFGWLFMVMASVIPVTYLVILFWEYPAAFTMFGLSYEGPPLALMPMLIASLILVNGICAFGLLFAKDWGLKACLYFGYVGLAISVGATIAAGGETFNLDPVVLVPYLYVLHKLSKHW
ncbi:hypothetical protein [Ferrimonas balearica]|uniref:hypothetical protein n=1 Tax=Ferrimonas balearica TaxID=44012 RepID=UPI001C9A0B4D|nr:hypothetical protein [Ferrimonas balearica]MBY5991178.1 hypothetical protein [Ferrimonas balearica]